MKATLGACAAVVARDARLYRSYHFRPLVQAIGTLFTLVLFYELSRLVSSRHFATPAAYFDYVVVGLALLPTLRFVLVMAPTTLRDELIAGTFEHFALSPLGPVGYLLGTLVFPALLGLANGIVAVAAGSLLGLHLSWATLALALPAALLAALAVLPFGALLLALTVLLKPAAAGAGWVATTLSLLGGAYFPVGLLPHWVRWASDAQPVTAALALMRHAVVGSPVAHPLADVLALALFAGVGLPVGAIVLGWACTTAGRRGTLLEY